MNKGGNFISDWGKKINWNKRVKAICKPCWEIKYCPYGPLVENFPIKGEQDSKSCRIFGHDCPVFYVAEPLTETKELRRITRSIPRAVQFKVLKRESQICDSCGQSVRDEDVEFDHIIPWSKGGPTEEYNIRLLCSDCNKKRGNKFEEEFLVKSVNEHLIDPYDVEILEFFHMTVGLGHDFTAENKTLPTAQDYADCLADGELTVAESQAAQIYMDFTEFFAQRKPKELKSIEFKFLKYRWGFNDNKLYSLKEACAKFSLELDNGVELDRLLLNRLGFRIKTKKSDQKKWRKY